METDKDLVVTITLSEFDYDVDYELPGYRTIDQLLSTLEIDKFISVVHYKLGHVHLINTSKIISVRERGC